MLKIGSIIMSIETGFQFIVSVLSLIISLVGRHAPILKMAYTSEELLALDAKYVTTTKALAIMHNTGAVISTFLVLVIIWTSLIHEHKWAFWVLLLAGLFGHIFWFVGDSFIVNQTLIINGVLTGLFLIGICLAGYGLFKVH